MKRLNEFIEKTYISLDGIDESLVSKIKNLNDQPINECCDCCGCCCNKIADPYYNPGQVTELQICNLLKNTPKVQNIWDIHFQFSTKHRFPGMSLEETKDPLYFNGGEILTTINYSSGAPQISNTKFTDAIANEKLYKFIKGLVNDFDISYPTVLESEGKLQLFAIKGDGSHFNSEGKDEYETKNIKKALENTAKLIGELENKAEITWAQVLDVSVYNASNIYNFLITMDIDSTKFQMTQEDYEKLYKKMDKIVDKTK